jgi:SulP family sulfate permease
VARFCSTTLPHHLLINFSVGLQMVENVPFCHELANIVIAHQGYGIDALSTLIVMFGLASVVVGIVFFLLGKFQLGRVVYFFPTHVSFTQRCRQRNIQSLQGF